MKKVQLLSLMGFIALMVTGCGNQNPNPAAYNYGQGYNGAQAGYGYGNYGYNAFNQGGYQGYWNNGQMIQLAGSTYVRSLQVQAGQVVQIGNIQWGVTIHCDRKVIDSYETKVGGYVANAVVQLNGQTIAANGGVVTAPAAGTMTIAADLASQSHGITCGAKNNRPYQILSYWVRQL